MKVNKFLSYIAAGLFMAGAMTSCMGDLNSDVIDPDVKPLDPQKMYVKCYASMIMEGNDGSADFDIDDAGKSTLLRNIYNLECLSTDEAICWWTDGGLVNASYNQSGAEDQVLRFMYYRLMSNITYCNHYLETEACLALGKDKAAEVRWIRAYNYYVLANTFGNVPFLTKISSEAAPRATREEMYHWLVAEFRAVKEDLLEARPKGSSDPDYGRLDKAAAWLMLSRMYLNAEVWKGDFNDADGDNLLDSVKVLSDKIITEGQYKLFTGEYLGNFIKVAVVRISTTLLSSGAVENRNILFPTARGCPSVVGLRICPPRLNCALPPPSAPVASHAPKWRRIDAISWVYIPGFSITIIQRVL